MNWTSGFFNDLGGDRLYNSEQLSDIFEGLISSGVYLDVGERLAVQPNNGLTIQINTGRGWFGGRWVKNDAIYTMTLDAADVTLNKYCAVCVRVDNNVASRKAEPYLKYGAAATTPAKPTMERNDTIKEYCLAYIYMPAGAKEITAAEIEDTRGNSELCGWVSGLIEQIDSKTLFEQFEQIFKNWLASLDDYLNEETEARIAADMVNLNVTAPVKAYGTFDGLAWDSQDDGTYLQIVNVQGVTPDNDIIVAPVDIYRDVYLEQGCEAIAQGNGTITFRCVNPMDTNMQVKVIIFNDPFSANIPEFDPEDFVPEA